MAVDILSYRHNFADSSECRQLVTEKVSFITRLAISFGDLLRLQVVFLIVLQESMEENDEHDVSEAREVLENRIKEAMSFLNDVEMHFHDVEGAGKLTNKLKTELQVLKNVRYSFKLFKFESRLVANFEMACN